MYVQTSWAYVLCLVLLSARMLDSEKSVCLILWTPIIYQIFSDYYIMLELGTFRTRLTNSQIGICYKHFPLN
jgi:hypothetical protein